MLRCGWGGGGGEADSTGHLRCSQVGLSHRLLNAHPGGGGDNSSATFLHQDAVCVLNTCRVA